MCRTRFQTTSNSLRNSLVKPSRRIIISSNECVETTPYPGNSRARYRSNSKEKKYKEEERIQETWEPRSMQIPWKWNENQAAEEKRCRDKMARKRLRHKKVLGEVRIENYPLRTRYNWHCRRRMSFLITKFLSQLATRCTCDSSSISLSLSLSLSLCFFPPSSLSSFLPFLVPQDSATVG